MISSRLVFAGLVLAAAAVAQDPPARVARLAYLNGQVSFQPAGIDDWSAAALNYPLTTGDHLYADQGSSAEIRIGPNALRVAHQTNVGFLNLDDRTVQIRLTEGSINLRVRGLSDQDVWEIDTPNGAISLLRSGEYRIDTDPNRNATMVTVRGGEAEVTANGQSFPVHARQTGFFTGDGQQQSIQAANPPDEFDRFSEDRDRLEDQAPPPRYVSENMIGYEDLDQNGTWQAQSEYGPIWRPRVRVGWSPYHDGHWAFREPWGWTWIDDAPWGFAPFHYGRWAYVGGGWGWCPGPVLVARPVYAPALVAFVGGGGSGVGWFPLGPREIYAPAYHVSPDYVRRVNFTNVREINNTTINNIVVNRNVTNFYVNQNAPGAISAVSRQDFVASRSVARANFQVSQQQLRSAQVTGFTPDVVPQRESFGLTAGNIARPQQVIFDRPVIARTVPPPAPVSFTTRQQALQGNGGRPLAPEQINGLRARQPEVQQPLVRSAVSPSQGFGRNAAGTSQPAQPASVNFGRTVQQPIPQTNSPAPSGQFGRAPQVGPRNDTQPVAPRNYTPPENRGGFGGNVAPQPSLPAATPPPVDRGLNRLQDRFESRPPQAAPRTETPQGKGAGFGRNTAPPQAAPQSTPQPNAPPANGGFNRPQQAPVATPPAENRGLNRQQDRVESRPPQAAPRSEPPPENRGGFGRNAAPQQSAPTPAAPTRQEAPAANRGFTRDAQPKADKPKEDKPKEERKDEHRFR